MHLVDFLVTLWGSINIVSCHVRMNSHFLKIPTLAIADTFISHRRYLRWQSQIPSLAIADTFVGNHGLLVILLLLQSEFCGCNLTQGVTLAGLWSCWAFRPSRTGDTRRQVQVAALRCGDSICSSFCKKKRFLKKL